MVVESNCTSLTGADALQCLQGVLWALPSSAATDTPCFPLQRNSGHKQGKNHAALQEPRSVGNVVNYTSPMVQTGIVRWSVFRVSALMPADPSKGC